MSTYKYLYAFTATRISIHMERKRYGDRDMERKRTIETQADDKLLDDKAVRVKKLTETAQAHLSGATQAVKRYASILGISEPKV